LALSFDKQIENSVGIAADLKALGLISVKQGNLNDAHDFMKRSLRVVAAIGLVPQARSVLSHLESIAMSLGLDAEAAEYRTQLEELVPAAQ